MLSLDNETSHNTQKTLSLPWTHLHRFCSAHQYFIEFWIWITKRQKQLAKNVITSLDTPAPFPDETGTGTAFASSLFLKELLAGCKFLYDHPCSRDHCLGCFILHTTRVGGVVIFQATNPPTISSFQWPQKFYKLSWNFCRRHWHPTIIWDFPQFR